MSFAILNGSPTSGQLHLDSVLDALVAESGREEDRYCIGKLLFKCLKDRPDSINMIEGTSGQEILNSEMLEKSIKTARAMRAAGVVKGDLVVITGVNQYLAVPYFASLFVGAVSFHIDAGATIEIFNDYFKRTKPKVIFADSVIMETIEQALCFDIKPLVVSFGEEKMPDRVTLQEFTDAFSGDVDSFRLTDVDRYDPSSIVSTSGSTGKVKLAILTNYGSVAKILDASIEDERILEPGCKFVSVTSCQWISYMMLTNACLLHGHAKVQANRAPSLQIIFQMFRKYLPEGLVISAVLASTLLNSEENRHDVFKCLKVVVVGGAPVSALLQTRFKEAIHPEGRVMVSYGCSELGGLCTKQTKSCEFGSCGKEMNLFEHKIMDDNDKELPDGTPGVTWVRSKGIICNGYFKDKSATKKAFTSDGWLKTEDIMYKDKRGTLFYVERKQFVMLIDNRQVHPNQLEAVIASVQGVKQVGVCELESRVAAVVVPRPGYKLTSQQIHDNVNSKLSQHQQLKGGVFFVEALPLTVTGKMDRLTLKTLAAQLRSEL